MKFWFGVKILGGMGNFGLEVKVWLGVQFRVEANILVLVKFWMGGNTWVGIKILGGGEGFWVMVKLWVGVKRLGWG